MNKVHQGKRLLIPANGVYGNADAIPLEEKHLLFVYKLRKINPDGVKASLDFENKCIKQDGDNWVNFADTAAEDADIDSELLNYDYKKNLKDDHERYNHYLGKINRVLNDKIAAEEEKLKEAALAEPNNVDAILTKYNERTENPKEKLYLILLEEFEPAGPLQDHTIGGTGKYAGQQSKKQLWRHKFSSRSPFIWHNKQGYDYFDRSTLWAQAKKIVKAGLPGSPRLEKIFLLKSGKGGVPKDAKLSRDEDMINRVYAVMAAVSSKSPLSIFDNDRMLQYLGRIAPGHSPPHCRERNRILQVIMDGLMLEIKRIVAERRKELLNAFASGSIDFFTEPHRKECFGAFVIDLVAEKYQLANGSTLFMSRQTKARLTSKNKSNLFLTGKSILANAELVLNFERFLESKTQTNVANWMKETCDEAGMEPGDFNQLSADGGEIGSVSEFEVLTRGDRPNDVEFDTCGAHQVSTNQFK